MACFGCSRRASKKNMSHDSEEDSVKTGSLTKKKKKNSMTSWPRLWTKKSDAKTVPVDVSVSGSLDPVSKSHEIEVERKNIGSSKKYRLPIGVNALSNYKKRLGTVKEIILERREINSLNSLAKDEKNDKKKSSRKKEPTKKTRPSKSSSPPENINPGSVTASTARVAQTSALPPQKKAKLTTRQKSNDNIVNHEKDSNEATNSNSMIGLSVIIVILLLMLFLGKLSAILCTSAWFYMIPRLRAAVDSNVTVDNVLEYSTVPDLNSDEHKKKVVLEGLLQRNQRNIIRIF
ncbi:hypothetical protein DCAR_0726912 [Daucus carota subsp. sativus]|uniref:Uncharacterized protein n=1 Tax=Daucus carota subsp. sativus TaxID=79200 RepID=A0AAF0XHY3_DAUCS|nr:PREDICTED: uncharacterized protein At5g23160-like [Daucus carota subsp. sativus]WOH07482.1 hypothetical protein DCAR_0726912 [Daucus carota subsp. sativus]